MVVDAWGFDSERQAKAHRLRALRFRLSIARTAALVALVVVLVFGGSASLRDAVQSLQWPSWTSTILFLVLLFLSFLAIDLPFAFVFKSSRRSRTSRSSACSSCVRPRRRVGQTPRSWAWVVPGG